MFARTDGPTALRRDIVHALSIAAGEADVELEPGQPRVSAVAAVGGVWNGRNGYVAVLLRALDPPELHRFTFKDPLDSIEDLLAAVRGGIEFATEYGFAMGDAAFRSLSEAEQVHRMRVWDAIRKLASDPLQGRPSPADSMSGRLPAVVIEDPDDDASAPDSTGAGAPPAGQSGATTQSGTSSPSGATTQHPSAEEPSAASVRLVAPGAQVRPGSVLGRMTIVRRQPGELRVRLLAQL